MVAVCGARMGDSPGRLSFLDIQSGDPLKKPLDFETPQDLISLSPDGTLLAAADANGLVRIIQVRDATDRGMLLVHPDAVTQMLFSHDNRLLLTVCRDQRVRLYDVRSGVLISAPSGLAAGPQSGIRAARFLGNTWDIIELSESASIWQVGNRKFSPNHASTLSRFLSGSIISSQGTIIPTPTSSLKEDFSNVTMGQILDSHLIHHLIPK